MKYSIFLGLALSVGLLAAPRTPHPAPAPSTQHPTPNTLFSVHEIATGLRGGYQVVIADINKDGKPDIIALAQGMPELAWYENPSWQKHVMATGVSSITCRARHTDPIPPRARPPSSRYFPAMTMPLRTSLMLSPAPTPLRDEGFGLALLPRALGVSRWP